VLKKKWIEIYSSQNPIAYIFVVGKKYDLLAVMNMLVRGSVPRRQQASTQYIAIPINENAYCFIKIAKR